jgi:tetratricopeptide (TPR) repeat protein/AraC-like DNA-binding protein/TolB-like protein
MTDAFSRDQTFINKLIGIIHVNLGNEAFGVNELAKASGLSLYTLGRRIHSINRKTVNQFIREARLRKAMEMLLNEEYSVSEVAYRTGFGSPAYFNKCFHEHFGYSPGKIKKGVSGNAEPDIFTGGNGNNKPGKITQKPKMLAYAGTLFLILVAATAAYLIYTRVQKAGQNDGLASPDGRISIAVMPFQNMTNDTLWDIWEDGIQINLITSLSNTEELKVRQSETVNGLLKAKGYTSYMSITPSVASSITQKLDAAFFVSGIINQAGNTIRLNAQLIDAKTEEPHRSFQIDGTPEMILQTIDSLSTLVHNTLIISKLGEERPDLLPKKHYFPTQSPEAYRYYTLGQTAYYKNDFPTAIEYFLQALSIDSSLASAMTNISTAYYNLNNYYQGRNWCLKSREKYDLMSVKDKIKNDAVYALYFRTLNDRIDCLRQLLALDDQNPMTWFNIGDCYYEMNEDYKAIPEFEKSLELFHKWGTKPYWGAFYYELGICYHRTGQYKKEKKLYMKADRDFPGDPGLMDQYAWLDFALGDTVGANRHLEDLISVRKKESWSDARIAGYLAYVYSMAGMPEKEEEFYRKALSLEPASPGRMNSLAYFLIDKDLSIDEGLDFVDKALAILPDNYACLHTKGWGLYKKGRYNEALRLLEKSWDLKPMYLHMLYLHLEEAKKAAIRQN